MMVGLRQVGSHLKESKVRGGCKVLSCQLVHQILRFCSVVQAGFELGLNPKQLELQCKPLYPAGLFYRRYSREFC